jgi:hypothetical protein
MGVWIYAKAIILVLIIAGCSKPKLCPTCVQTTRTTVSPPTQGYPKTTTMEFISCDHKSIEGEKSATIEQNGIRVTTVTNTTCK